MSFDDKQVQIIDNEEVYLKPFTGDNEDNPSRPKAAAALERAWKNRDFEIDKYWSRATYFWAFIAATFAGFIAVKSSVSMELDKKHLGFMINCLGIIFSWAWTLVNISSKKWQENWEKHIDMLEDTVTGPLYKTVLSKSSYSVSRVNILVSKFVVAIWLMLAYQELYAEFQLENSKIDILIWITVIATILCIVIFHFGAKSEDWQSFQFKRRLAMGKAIPEQKPEPIKSSEEQKSKLP